MTNKNIALSYLNKGMSVIPLWSLAQIKRKPPTYFVEELNKKDKENKASAEPKSDDQVYQDLVTDVCKRPMIGWKQFQSRQPTEQEILEWFGKWPDANIGIVTGSISNLVVFDLDSEGAVEYANNEGGFPNTVKVKTGKGYHVYMRHPGFEVKGSINKELDIDIRADGNYVVAPPSIHGSSSLYEWEEGYSISEIDPAPCTPWMFDYLKNVAESPSKSKQSKENTLKPSDDGHMERTETPHDEYTGIFKKGAVEGMRNHTATKLTGHLFARGISESEVWEMLKMWNSTKNSPPLNESELRKTFESVRKLESKNQKKQEKKIDVTDFLDTSQKIVDDHDQSYVRIPFAGNELSQLETMMNGGLIGGRFYLLGGIPSASKTMLANNMADNICFNGQPVLFFSLDDGKADLRYRSFARFSSYDIEDFNQNRLNKNEIGNICEIENIKKIMQLKYVVEKNINIEKWKDLIEQIKKRHQKAPVIIIDYLRKLRTNNKISDERLRVDDILSNLTGLAKKYNIPILAITELARDSYKSGQKLNMGSSKESGTIEYEASWLGILAVVEEKNGIYILKNDWEKIINQDGNIDLIVFKTKRGTGVTGKIPLKVNRDKMVVKDRMNRSKHDSVSVIKTPSMFGNRGI